MLRSVGYHVTHYGVGGAESGANEQVDVMTRAEQEALLGRRYDPNAPHFVGNAADVGTPLYRAFNQRLRPLLAECVEPGDTICLPFGHAHAEALGGPGAEPLRRAFWLETGIGYPTTFCAFKVYESEAWRHWHLGKDSRAGNDCDYEWVIPNYFDVTEWEPRYEPGEYLLYFGRIDAIKGLNIVVEIAKARPDLQVVLCGQGDPAPFLTLPNISYRPPVWGRARSDLLRRAIALLVPTRYVEPFGGVTVEANLCGTPALGASFGAFTETIEPGVNGYRCRTLGDWLAAVSDVEERGASMRRASRRLAVERYDMMTLAHDYDRVLRQLGDLSGAGWFTRRSYAIGQQADPCAEAAE